jgi:Fe-S cluster assembly scaffold protein SufB
MRSQIDTSINHYYNVVKCLHALYAPEGNELKRQRKLQSRMQKTGEQLVKFAGELRVLADRPYPKWSLERKQEVLRNQFMQGVRSSSVQLQLMKGMPPTPEDALKLASQLEAVEEAQNRLQKDRCQVESLALTEDAEDGSCTSNAASDYNRHTGFTQEKASLEERFGRQIKKTEEIVHQLSTQVQQLLKESARGTSRSRWPASRKDGGTGQKRASGPICWECGKQEGLPPA